MASIGEALTAALDHHLAGRLAEAEILYGRIRTADPAQAGALHMLGVLHAQTGRLDSALGLLRRAVACAPDLADQYANLAGAQRAHGDPPLAALRRAARLAPTPERLFDLANAPGVAGGPEEAQCLRQAAVLGPDLTGPWVNLGAQALDRGAPAEAAPCLEHAARLAPPSPALAANLGRLRHAQSRPAEAEPHLRASLAAAPDQPSLRTTLWEVEKALGRRPHHHSHDGQDAFVHEELLGGRADGVFVDIGAFDGATWSNTLFFERRLGWSGLCVEPSPTWFPLLAANRAVPCLNVAVGDTEGEAEFLDVVDGLAMMGGLAAAFTPEHRAFVEAESTVRPVRVPVRRLSAILAEHGITHIDYLSIDAEGAESAILDSLDPARVTIDAVTLESARPDPALRARMEALGFRYVCRFGGGDEAYVRR